MTHVLETPVARVDGPDKVSGRARYAAEFTLPGLVHAALVTSTISRGRIAHLETADAQAAPGVIAVITHENAPPLPYEAMEDTPPVDPDAGEQLHVLQDAEVLYSGQPIAMVVAETREQAVYAASLVHASYEVARSELDFERAPTRRPPLQSEDDDHPGDTIRGDPDATTHESDVTVDENYGHPRMHHNAMEPHATIAVWQNGRLTLYDKTQWVDNDSSEIAHVFGMSADDVHVVSPFVGGAFGSALRTWPHVTLAAMAAKVTGRPVRVELTRRQLYAGIGFRPRTEQRVSLSATADGRLTRMYHEARGQTSRYETYVEKTVMPTQRLYACPNVNTRYRLVQLDTNTPCPMRAPGTVSGHFALESAMDELADALDVDPIALRITNHADHDEQRHQPWSSKELIACYEAGASTFGWERRQSVPGVTTDPDGFRIGYGMATTMYQANRAPASAKVTVYDNGTAVIRSAASDMGPGTYTSMTQIAAEILGLPLDAITIELGDTDLPKAPVHGGSITLASVGSAVHDACRDLRDRLESEARQKTGRARRPVDELLRIAGMQHVSADVLAKPDGDAGDYASAAFGAVFAEVRVDPDLGSVSVPRLVGAFDIGRVINPLIARSQCIGGMVGGLGMALMEQAEWDVRHGRVMNANMAEYLMPVCADIGDIDVTFVPSEDKVLDPLGAKGVAELSINGVAPAIANAVYNATGQRVRNLPITPEKLLI